MVDSSKSELNYSTNPQYRDTLLTKASCEAAGPIPAKPPLLYPRIGPAPVQPSGAGPHYLNQASIDEAAAGTYTGGKTSCFINQRRGPGLLGEPTRDRPGPDYPLQLRAERTPGVAAVSLRVGGPGGDLPGPMPISDPFALQTPGVGKGAEPPAGGSV